MREGIEKYIKTWESRCYKYGIPEEVPCRIEQLNKSPSYKQLVKAILKNDFSLKTLGIEIKKPKPYHEIKRIEINSRGLNKQLKLF